jgi:Mrp family chromosome partitioning ATPase
MGRMLELLKNRDEVRPLDDTKEPPRVRSEVVTEWSMRDEEVPFVEVGPDRSITGSPLVMNAPVPRPAPKPTAVQPPHAPTEQALVRSPLTAKIVTPAPLAVAFEPFNGLYELGKVAAEIVTYHDTNHPISKQYATLAEQLLETEAGKALLLAGIRSGVGTSTVLLNLAVAAAQKTHKAIAVVDANRQQPSLAAKLGIKPLATLQDVLNGTVALGDALLKSPLPRLALLAASASHPEIVIGVEALSWLLATLKQRHDLVFVDGPSLDRTPELSPLVPLADSLFVVSPQGEPAATARPLFQLIARLGGRLRGLLHTQVGG